jgi:hypothetical protein
LAPRGKLNSFSSPKKKRMATVTKVKGMNYNQSRKNMAKHVDMN